MKICVIISAYNESEVIFGLIKEIKKQNLTVLVIDDGSHDFTVKASLSAGAIVLENKVNQGKGACLKKGFRYALENNFDAVITIDGDGQHLPSDIPNFINLADSNNDLLIGNRMHQTKNMPLVRILTNKFMSRLLSLLSKQDIPDTQCGFRLIKKNVLERVKLNTSKFETESEILIKASRLGFKIDSVPITTVYRGEKSQINPLLDTLRFLRFIIKTDR